MAKILAFGAALGVAFALASLAGRIEWNPLGADAQVRDFGGLHFKIEIEGLAARNFLAVDGLSIETEVIEFQEGDDPLLRKRPGRVKYGDIVLKRGYVAGSELFAWAQAVATSRDGADVRKDITVSLMDREGNVVDRWVLFECWPKSWKAPRQVGERTSVPLEEVEIAVERVERAKRAAN